MELDNVEKGQSVLLICSAFYYWGTIESIGLTAVTLNDAHIVYQTGAFEDGKSNWQDSQRLPFQPWSIKRNSIESFGVAPWQEK